MKKLFFLTLLIVSCRQNNIAFVHGEKTNFLTIESNGNNLDDYVHIKKTAEGMCSSEGMTHGIDVIDARPYMLREKDEPPSLSYTMQFTCK